MSLLPWLSFVLVAYVALLLAPFLLIVVAEGKAVVVPSLPMPETLKGPRPLDAKQAIGALSLLERKDLSGALSEPRAPKGSLSEVALSTSSVGRLSVR